ncbi:MAG: tetratricopeptide repeat protein, partial [Desulfobulbaceae bacterium]
MGSTRTLRHLLYLLLLAGLVSAAYSNSFQVPFTFDDFANIINKKSIRTFTPDLAGIISAASEGQSGTRWLPNLSLALNYFFGGEQVWGYHLVNLSIHLCCALVLYLLCLTTLHLPAVSGPADNRAEEIAMAAALLWAVHPLQTNAVTYLVQRMTSMCALFYLAALLCYVQGRLRKESAGERSFFFGATLLFGLMAVTSKENGLMLPVMVLGYEVFFLKPRHWLKNNLVPLLAWTGAGLALILLLTVVFLGKEVLSGILEGYDYRNFTLSERLLTEARVIFLYLGLLAFPSPARLNLNHEVILSRSLFSPPQTVLALLGILFLLGLIIWTFKKNRLFSFALFWFLGNLVIESTVVPLELVYEHRLYLPSTFVILSTVSLLYSLGTTRPWPVRSACILLACLLAFWTWQRNQVWATGISLWSDVVAKSPGLARGYNNLGVAYHEARDFKTAQALFEQAIRIEPESRIAYISLGSMYVTQDRLAEAEQTLRLALTKEAFLSPSRIYHYLGVVYRKAGNYPAAMEYSRRA